MQSISQLPRGIYLYLLYQLALSVRESSVYGPVLHHHKCEVGVASSSQGTSCALFGRLFLDDPEITAISKQTCHEERGLEPKMFPVEVF